MKRLLPAAAALAAIVLAGILAPRDSQPRPARSAASVAPAATADEPGTLEVLPEEAPARTLAAGVDFVEAPGGIDLDVAALRALRIERLAPPREGRCRLIVLTKDGVPVRPDRDRAVAFNVTPTSENATATFTASNAVNNSAAVTAANELTFTYDSPTYPWTPEELSTLQSWIGAVYPLLKGFYGAPAYDISINVRKDPTITGNAGVYVSASNEFIVKELKLDVVAHEMAHAFHDDAILYVCGYEEPMARAAEVEVLHLMGEVHPFDDHHSYPYDARYEAYNKRALSRFASYNSLLYYQVGSYVWAKIHYENPGFLSAFNQEYYSKFYTTPSVSWDAAAVRAIVEANVSTVEGQAVPAWYDAQWVLNGSSTAAYELLVKNEDFALWYFYRDASGGVTKMANATVEWLVYDSNSVLLASGTVVTTDWGVAQFYPTLPAYKGKLRVVVKATAPDGSVVVDSTWRNYDNGLDIQTYGLFGVVVGANAGTVTAHPAGDPSAAVSATVENGQYDIASLKSFRGTLVVTYAPAGGGTPTVRTVTKDSSSYFVPFVPSNAAPYAPSTPVGPSAVNANAAATFTTSATDPDGDEIQYTFDWGDGSTSTTDYLASGTIASASHAWTEAGNYFVKVLATDSKGASSFWSVAKTVGIESSYVCVNSITMWTAKWLWWKYVRIKVTVVDQAGKPVAKADVTGTLILPSGAKKSGHGLTGSTGTITFQYSKWGSLPKGTYTFVVEKVSHPNLPYDESKNVETKESLTVQ
ncbi:MAG: PKD domain-containing protein [Planctomycetes bacterium]|nr:PKD domain-containing protein [Planctomycetota bacterium]